jgi:hypothetical protein
MTMQFKNTGQIAANRIYFYYVFKTEQPDKNARKEDIQHDFATQEPIVHERLVFPKEDDWIDMTMDKDALDNYYTGQDTFLHILVRYNFSGGDNERKGSYIGVLRLRRSGESLTDIEKEWAE